MTVLKSSARVRKAEYGRRRRRPCVNYLWYSTPEPRSAPHCAVSRQPAHRPAGACPRPQAAAEASREGIPAGTPVLSRGRRRFVPSPVTPCFGQPRPRPQPSGAPEAVRGVVRPGSPILSRGRHQFGRVRAAHPRVSRPAGGVDRPGRWPGGACPRPQAAAEASREGIPAGTPVLSRGRRRFVPSPVTPCFGQPRPRPQPSGAPEAVRGVVRPGSPILSRGRHQFGRVRAAHPHVSRPAGGHPFATAQDPPAGALVPMGEWTGFPSHSPYGVASPASASGSPRPSVQPPGRPPPSPGILSDGGRG